MKKIISAVTLSFVVVLLLFTFLSCSSENIIIGTWQDSTGTTMQFFKDGTFTSSGLFSTNGTYNFPDDNHLKLEYTGLLSIAGAMIYEYEIEDNKLFLTDSYGTTTEWIKNK